MDSWGKILSTTGTLANTVGKNQPFRYRGYVYDNETQWYYLQSRYYDPSLGRFVSSDVYLSTGQGVLGHNSYAYCLNNPVNWVDPSGSLCVAYDELNVPSVNVATATSFNLGTLFKAIAIGVIIFFTPIEPFEPPELPKAKNKELPKKPKYPGNDPTKSPGKAWEWRGKGPIGGGNGNYTNPNTGESLHPDLNHPKPIGPHWDYRDPSGQWWRLFENGTITPK